MTSLSLPAAGATTAPTRRQPPPAPAAERPRRVALAVGAVLAVALGAVVLTTQGPRPLALLALGLGFGIALFHSRFGFTSAWRQLVAVGQGKALRAHAVLLGGTALLFAPLFAIGEGFGGIPLQPSVAPVGVALAIGATMFGLGMQLGGACASGTLFAVGSGQTSIVLTLGGFVAGSTIGAQQAGLWKNMPAFPAISLAEPLGNAGALAVTLAVLGAIVGVTLYIERRRTPPPVAPVPTAQGFARVVRGSWPMFAGAAVLAVLGALTLLTRGSPWGVTSAFALWGSKIAGFFGAQPETWGYWQGANAAKLTGPVLADSTSLLNFGIIIGALIASATAGAFVLHKRIPWRLAAGAVVGGLLMGYGARLASGCNIGAYLGGIASFSLHGWAWAVFALAGTWLGLKARPLIGQPNPKPTDSIC